MAIGGLELTSRPDGGAIDIEVMKRKSWPGISAQFVRVAAPATYDFHIDRSSNYIALLNLYRVDGETVSPGLPRSVTKDLRNKLAYSPSGSELDGWCKIDKAGTISAVTIEQQDSSRSPIDLTQIPTNVEFEDEMLRSVLLRFQAILDDPSLDTPGYAETLAELLTFELDRAATRQRARPIIFGGLSPAQVRLVTDYMDSHLSEKTAISELAGLLDLTRFHFIRSFKQATGMPPHQYMIRRRVDRAKELLAERDTSISEVAAKTGFGSSTQLTRAFRRVVGATPSAFRQHGW